jgi:hypothetical protein
VFRNEPGDTNRLYVGEADLLWRRIYGYLRPGSTQQTNRRIRPVFEQELRNGNRVALDVLAFEPFELNGTPISMADLSSKFVRRLLENWFAIMYSKAGYTLLNA